MSIGAPLPRPDGRVKVTGRARYAADHRVDDMLHGAFVGATVAAGRVRAIDATAALAAPGVVRVLTRADLPRLRPASSPPSAVAQLPMQDDEIRHEGQPVAIVLADTLEAAAHGASLVFVDVEPLRFVAHPGGDAAGAVTPRQSGYTFAALDEARGDADAALARSPLRHEATYVQPSRHHNPMEPSATLAVWSGDSLTVTDAVQHVYGVRSVLAELFGLAPENVRVRSPHTGGGFGCKGFVWPHQALTAAAAKVAGRPVRIALTRAQMYAMVGYQPQLVQTIALGADAEGRLSALVHEAVNVTAAGEDFVEFATEASKSGYAAPALRLAQRVQRANVNMPTAMRAPVEGCGLWPLESALNELADRLGIDPLELRLRNFAEVDPATGKPWSSNELRACYKDGARAFGWRAERRRDGPWLVGQGMASCAMGCFRFPSQASVRVRADGTATVEAGFQDIGTGTLTIFPQIAADVLGLDPARVDCAMGDSDLPETGPTYGSSSTMGVGASVLRAAQDALARLEVEPGASWDAIAAAMREIGVDEVVGTGSFAPHDSPYAMRTFGAVFVEVGVDPELGLLRLRRVVGRYSAGRIVNPRTARAQMTGGIIWGWGKVAMEPPAGDCRFRGGAAVSTYAPAARPLHSSAAPLPTRSLSA